MDWKQAAGPAPQIFLAMLAAHAVAFGHRPPALAPIPFGILVSALALGLGLLVWRPAAGVARWKPVRSFGFEPPLLAVPPFLLSQIHGGDGPGLPLALAVVVVAAAGGAMVGAAGTFLLRQRPGATRIPTGLVVGALAAGLACLKGWLMLQLFG